MACTSYICPGDFSVWFNVIQNTNTSPTHINATPSPLVRENFVKVPEVLTWGLEPSTDDPTKFRTADTGGDKIAAACTLATDWTATVTTKLCLGNWLYDKLLVDPGNAALWYNPGVRISAWWYLSWAAADNLQSGTFTAGNVAATNPGVYFFGVPTPPSLSGDNDADETTSAEFTIQVSSRLYFPNFV